MMAPATAPRSRPVDRRRRRRATTTAAGMTTTATAATIVHGGPSVTLAIGSAAPARTIVHIAVSSAQAGSPRTVATIDGPPSTASAPPARATIAAAIAGATSGTIARLIAGEIRASRPKVARTTGSVAAWAARDTPSDSASQPGTRPPATDRSRSSIRFAQARMPAVASVDSWKPGVEDEPGLDREQDRRRPAERGRRPARAPALAGEEDHAGHRRGADDRRRRAGEEDVGHDRDRQDHGSPTPAEATGERRDGGRHDRDVPAGDRHDVARPDGREVRGEVAVDPVAEPDDDSRRESRLRLRDRGGQRIPGAAAEALEGCARPRDRAVDPKCPRSRACRRPRSAGGSRRTARPAAARPLRRP